MMTNSVSADWPASGDRDDADWRHVLAHGPVVRVPLNSLRESDSPRLSGPSHDHVKVLAESAQELPPIIVHRHTMRVIDGAHRIRAARLRGQESIDARFYDGPEEEAFLLAVAANISHGMPLSLADRTAAAGRILASHPQWSDRAVAAVVGLSGSTVAAIRRRATDQNAQLRTRVGRDGRVRPLSSAEGRRRAAELITSRPDVSLRQVAAEAGISQGTARDVRDRLLRGDDPVPARRGADRARPVLAAVPTPDADAILSLLKRDPSLRFTDAGRSLIQIFDAHAKMFDDSQRLASTVPSHCAGMIAELARTYATVWQKFAHSLENGG